MIWTEKQDANLRAWSGAGLSAGKIAKTLGVTRNTVCGRKFRLGICTPENAPRPYSDKEKGKIISMREHRRTYREIAESLGRTEGAIQKTAFYMGLSQPREITR